MRLERLQSYVLLEPTALVLEDHDERILITSSDGSTEAHKKAIASLRAALDELQEAVDPYEAYLKSQTEAGPAVAA